MKTKKNYDQFKNSDKFEDPEYIRLFQTLLQSINENEYIHLVYGIKDNSKVKSILLNKLLININII